MHRINNTIKITHTITSPNITIPTAPTELTIRIVIAINKININANIVNNIIYVPLLSYKYMHLSRKTKERAFAQSFQCNQILISIIRFKIVVTTLDMPPMLIILITLPYINIIDAVPFKNPTKKFIIFITSFHKGARNFREKEKPLLGLFLNGIFMF